MELNGTHNPSLPTGSLGEVESENEVNKLWREFGKTRGEDLRNQLMLRYEHCVRPIAMRIHWRVPREVEIDDLMSAGIFGLMDAIDGFKLEYNVKFETYCQPRIRGAILDELREMDWVPRLVRYRSAKINVVRSRFAKQLGREPTLDEIQECLGLNPEELERFSRDSVAVKTTSLSKRIKAKEGVSEFGKLLVDHGSESPDVDTESEDLRRFITRGLSRTTSLIISLYHFEGYTMNEVADLLFMSESRVSQLHTAAIKQIRSNIDLERHYRSHQKF